MEQCRGWKGAAPCSLPAPVLILVIQGYPYSSLVLHSGAKSDFLQQLRKLCSKHGSTQAIKTSPSDCRWHFPGLNSFWALIRKWLLEKKKKRSWHLKALLQMWHLICFFCQPALAIIWQLTKLCHLGRYLGKWWGTSSGIQGRFCCGNV